MNLISGLPRATGRLVGLEQKGERAQEGAHWGSSDSQADSITSILSISKARRKRRLPDSCLAGGRAQGSLLE